jgi:hypothetical protein
VEQQTKMVPKPSESSRADLVQVYRSQADSALGHAENAASRDLKELYLRLAECWCTLAQFETLALGMS